MDSPPCDCDSILRSHGPLIGPCPIHGSKGKAAWERLEAQNERYREALEVIADGTMAPWNEIARSAITDHREDEE